jgi:hypothetical protein
MKNPEINKQYNNAANLLLSAMLREPHEAYKYPQLCRQWFASAYNSEIAGAWFDLYSPLRGRSHPTPNAIAAKCGCKVSEVVDILKADTTGLETAVEIFESFFPTFVEWMIAQQTMTMIERGGTQGEVIQYAETTRRENHIAPDNSAAQMSLVEYASKKITDTLPPAKILPPQRAMIRTNTLFGLWPADLVGIAGRPGMGKTQEALSLANDAIENGHRVLFFSLEMSALRLKRRLLQMRQEVNHHSNWAQFGEGQKAGILNDAAVIENSRVKFYDRISKLHEIKATCKAEHAKEEVHLIIIDYLQLIETSESKGNQNTDVSTITRSLKNLATELDLPIVALSQLSRAVEARGGSRRPQLHDLRDSGSIEQDCDVVIFPYRPYYYGILEDGEGRKILLDEKTGLQRAYLIVAKNRDGATNDVEVRYDPVRGYHDGPDNSGGFTELPF